MGLFGGFRAKFTRNSKSKETTKEVVCLKYLVHSEFDPVNTSNGFVPIRPALRKNSFTPPDKKQKRVQVKSQIIETHTEPKSLQIKKSKSFNNIVDLPPPPPKTPPPDIATERKFLDDTFKTVTRPKPPLNTNPVLKIDNVESDTNNDAAPPDYFSSYDEPSTLILMTQHSSEPSPSFRIVEQDKFSFVQDSMAQYSSEPSPSFKNVEEEGFLFVRGSRAQHSSEQSPSVEIVEEEGFSFMQGSRAQHSSEQSPSFKNVEEEGFSFVRGSRVRHSSEPSPPIKIVEDEGFSFLQGSTETNHYVEFPPDASDASTLDADDFHVNIMEYSDRKRYSMSEDEISNNDIVEDHHQEDFMEYSSQASSIFFGNDMQPVPARRRMITLQDNDGNNRRTSEEDGEC